MLLQILPPKEAAERKAFYAERHIGYVARPKHGDNGYIRRGRFKKVSTQERLRFVSRAVR